MTLSVNIGVGDSMSPSDQKSKTPGLTLTQRVLLWFSRNSRAALGELLATLLLLLLGCMTCVPLPGHDLHPPMYAEFGFGCVVLFNIQIFGHISGAHMNPAVTLGAMLYGTMPPLLGLVYVLMQCAGACAGYYLLTMLMHVDVASAGICVTLPQDGLSSLQAFGIEVFLTAALQFVNCSVWDPVNKAKQDSVPVKFGLTIAGLSLVGGPLTGASMNPARSLGPALITGNWRAHQVYWFGPIIGSVLSTVIYKYFWLVRDDEPTLAEEPLKVSPD